MATIPKTGIVNGQTADASQVTNIIDALDGTTSYKIEINGPITASSGIKGTIDTSISSSHAISSSYAVSSSHTLNADDAISSSFANSSSYAVSSSHAITASYSLNGGSSVAGVNQQIQFNKVGAFGADSNFTFNNTSNTLSVGTASLTEIQLPNSFIIRDGTESIIFNQGQEDVSTQLYGFGGTTSLTLAEDTTTLLGQMLTVGNSSTTNYLLLFSDSINIGDNNTSTTAIAGTTVNVGTSSTLTQLGATNQRIKLGNSGTTTGVITEGNTYVIKSGTNAFNIGTSTSSTLNANNRINFEVNSNTSVMTMRGVNGSTQNLLSLTNFGNFSSFSADVGGTHYTLNDFSGTSNLSFGNTITGNNKMILYVAGNSDNSRPGIFGGSRGGLKIAHTLELGATSAWKTSGTAWSTTSDSRLKENIITASLDICYDTIKTLPLKRFNYVDKYTQNPIGDRTQLGWIAQDVRSLLPKAVVSSSFTTWVDYSGETITGSNNTLITSGSRVQDVLAGSEVIDDILTLDSDQIIKMMYGAIQKLQAKVEALENQ